MTDPVLFRVSGEFPLCSACLDGEGGDRLRLLGVALRALTRRNESIATLRQQLAAKDEEIARLRAAIYYRVDMRSVEKAQVALNATMSELEAEAAKVKLP